MRETDYLVIGAGAVWPAYETPCRQDASGAFDAVIRWLALPVLLAASSGCTAALAGDPASLTVPAHPEARPYSATSDARADLAEATARAAANGKLVLIAMGGNWCHDSRALAGWLETPRFIALTQAHYEVVFVDAGTPRSGGGRNLDIAERYGVDVVGTPSLIVAAADGRVLNASTAAAWYDAASRSGDAIFGELASYVVPPDN